MRPARAIAVFVTAGSLAVLAGCGDDSGGASDITKEDFVTQANAICDAGNTAVSDAADALGDAPTDDQIAAFLKSTLVPSVRKQIADIRDLGFPKGDEDELDGVLDESEDLVGQIDDDPAKYASQLDTDPFEAVNAKLDAYGLTSCGSG